MISRFGFQTKNLTVVCILAGKEQNNKKQAKQKSGMQEDKERGVAWKEERKRLKEWKWYVLFLACGGMW